MKKLLSSLIGLASFTLLSAQCSVVEVPLVQRVSASTTIVEGTVIDQYSYWNSDHSMIYTANVVDLYKIFKGSLTTQSVEIITEGGTVGMDRISVEPSLNLNIGDVGMFTCIAVTRAHNNPTSRNSLPQFEAYASLQGFVKYNESDNTASDPFRSYLDLQTEVYNVCGPIGHHQYLEVKARPDHSTQREGDNTQAGLTITSFSPGTLTAGTGAVLTINGSGFGAVQGTGGVSFRNADDGGATFVPVLQTQIISWSTSQILVEVPSNAGTGVIRVTNGSAQSANSTGTLTITYAHLNVNFDPGAGTTAYQTDHVNDDGNGGYTWRMSNGFAGDAPAVAAFTRAFDAWRCSSGVYWTIGSNTAVNDAVSDGTNVICYDNTAPLSAGILGVCYSYWSGCASGPNIIWYVNELDIIFDEGSNITPLTWCYGPSLPTINQYDFETVAVHELGHGHQLGHVIELGAIMHYAISNGSSNRSLSANDISGSNFIQQKSIITNICGPGAMSTYVCGSAPVAAFSVNDQTACSGQVLSFTDLSTNSPNAWSWSFTGGSPNNSTLQNPTVTYSTPGLYDVTLVATNGVGSDSQTMSGYITVSGNPTVGFTASPVTLTVCNGQPMTLSGNGAVSYNWSGGVTDNVPFNPSASGSYTVTGTDANGCTGTDVAGVTVNAAPSMTITCTPSNSVVCTGSPATLTASGAASYSWTGGITNGVAFTPPSTSSYTVTGTGANGCTSTAARTVTVQSCNGTTQLNATWCGAVNCNLNQTVVCNTVSGATNYEFKFVNAALSYSQSRQRGNGTANMPLSWIAGLQYNTTYTVTVRAYVGGVWQAYGSSCSVTMAAQVPTTSITNCAATNLTYGSSLSVTSVAGAQDYEYTITNATQPLTEVRLRGSNVASIGISWFTGIQYGRTYNCTVRVKVGGVWSQPGPTCTFSMQASAPTTQLTVATCGASGVTGATTLTWTAVTGSTNYRVNIKNSGLGFNQTKAKGSSGTTMGVSQFSGLLMNNTYTVSISSYIGGAWSAYGPACTITMGANVRMSDPGTDEENAEFNFGVSMYPNPLGSDVNPTVTITGADQKDAVVQVMDLTGRVVATYAMHVEGDEFSAQLSAFPDLVAGMYIMQVTVGDQVQSQKFIAE